MKKFAVVLVVLALAASCAFAQDFSARSYSWNGSSGVAPHYYQGGTFDKMVMQNGRFQVGVNSGSEIGWSGHQFNNTYLAQNNEVFSGSITFRVDNHENGFTDGAKTASNYLFMWNMCWGNGLNSFMSIKPSECKSDVANGWYQGGHGEYGKWEMNPNVVGAAAPTGYTYIFNSFQSLNPATNADDIFKLVALHQDQTVSWTSWYDAGIDKVVIDTKLNGADWTHYLVGRDHFNLGWGENRLPKKHGATFGYGFEYDYSNVQWAPVPEPGSIFALASGLLGFAGLAIRRRK